MHAQAERRPRDPWTWWRLGTALAQKAQRARDGADRAAATAALRHAAGLAWEGELLGHLAAAFAELGELDLAIATMRRATDEAAGATAADHEWVARRLLDAGRTGDALGLLARAGDAVETEDALRLLRAFAHAAGDGGDAALADAEVVLARRPDHADAHLLKARVLAAQGRTAECLAAWATAAARLPGDDEILSGYGVALASAGRTEEAIEHLALVVQRDPTSSDALLNLGLVLRDAGQLDEAEWTVKRALELRPDSAAAHHDLGLVQEAAQRWEEAAASFRAALTLDPKRARSRLGLAKVLKRLGRTQQAVDVLVEARGQSPGRDAAAQQEMAELLAALGSRAATHTSAFAGQLGAFNVTKLLTLLAADRSTGRLEITVPRGKGEILFREGQIVRMTAGHLPRLAGVVASLPGVDADRLGAALAAHHEDSADVPVGRHLLRVGALDEPTLRRGREVQILIGLESLLDSRDGTFAFHKQAVDPMATDVSMDPQAALAEIARLRGGA